MIQNKWKDWRNENNIQEAKNGQIWLFWKPEIKLSIIKKTSQMIHCQIDSGAHGLLLTTFIYASNSIDERRQLWDELRNLSNPQNNRWCLLGDFNAVKDTNEVLHPGREVQMDRSMEEFRGCLYDLKLMDHPATGCYYTWSNKREEGLQHRKLDRILINESWADASPFSIASFQELRMSNHCPAILMIKEPQNSGPKPFRFFNHWAKQNSFLPLVQKTWETSTGQNPIMVLYTFLKTIKQELRKCGAKEKEENSELTELRRKVTDLQSLLMKRDSDISLQSAENEARKKMYHLMQKQEAILRQKSRIQWLQLGDSNSSYFHRAVKSRQARNSIHLLINEMGHRLETYKSLKMKQFNTSSDFWEQETIKSAIPQVSQHTSLKQDCQRTNRLLQLQKLQPLKLKMLYSH